MINLCIHGHFYQPPRENPWTGEIEKQPSAAPYHDWNERIYFECYKPNSEAEIISEGNITADKVNNYEYINFNFGPTLLDWIKEKHPDTYNKIIEADKTSRIIHNGHGNAIAQCYNHMIMPLASYNDKVTQVKWGLKYFEYHFCRKSEGIWLPETACNADTIEVLIDEGVKYIILDTNQAEAYREEGNNDWINVSNGTVNPFRTYKCYTEKSSGKYINIFFYDGPLSRNISFDDVLKSSSHLLERIKQVTNTIDTQNQLLSIATDGETFGHHKKFSERTLAYFIKYLAPQNNIKIVNYGEFLEQNPAKYEVKIKRGKNDEGTSWSCPHGVERWKDDCGCSSDSIFHQRWRKPLRNALDWLRDKLIVLFENEGNKYLKNVWRARNDYIEILCDPSESSKVNFFSIHGEKLLNSAEQNYCLKLLEMQKYAMFMYTSCGWFFSEISGLESVKILEYAARAIELAEEVSGANVESEFIKLLSLAESNIPEYMNGEGVYLNLVKPNRI
jgi:alpha-amylase/alpha-mannosidase (GH57 family)